MAVNSARCEIESVSVSVATLTISERIDDPTSEAGPVTSRNEWDRLEEVVLGVLDGAAAEARTIPKDDTRRDLQTLSKLLSAEGVTVHRPEPAAHTRTFETVDWKERGFSSACPRDAVLIVDDEIIETPLGWRARFYETDALRDLFLSYFRAGARWTSAPRPELKDDLYAEPTGDWLGEAKPPIVINESEPILSAADVIRADRHLFAMRTAGTNQAGITWLRRHVSPRCEVHEIEPRTQVAGQLDTVFTALGPGEILLRKDAIDPATLPEVLRDHRIRIAPAANSEDAAAAMNVLLLDPKRVLVEAAQTDMVDALRSWGYEVIPVALAGYAALGGSIRRATLDIRRRAS